MNKILNFHPVKNKEWFEGLICYLKSRYEFINIETLYSYYQGKINLKNTCHITVDDGDKSFIDVIFPILKKYEIPSTLFVSPKICLEKKNYWFQEMQDYDQLLLKQIISEITNISFNTFHNYSAESILKTQPLQQIHEIIKQYQNLTHTAIKEFQNISIENLKVLDLSGLVTIGAHTLNHPILLNEDDDKSCFEIKESINVLAGLLHHEIKYFAYPNGIPDFDFSVREKNYLRESGIKMAFSTEAINISDSDDIMSIPRIGISDSENMYFFGSKMFLGTLWELFSKIKPTGEYSERKALRRIYS